MSEIETVLTVISVIGALSTILFAYLAFKRANKKKINSPGKTKGSSFPTSLISSRVPNASKSDLIS